MKKQSVFNKFMNSKFSWSIIVTVFAIALFFAVAFIASMVTVPALIFFDDENIFSSVVSVVFPVVLIASSIGFAAIFKKKFKKSLWQIIGWRKPNKKALWLTPAVLCIYIGVLAIVMMILFAISPEAAEQEQEVVKELARLSGPQLAMMVIGVGILTPLAEETLFRGLMLSMYAHRLKYLVGVFIGASLFAVAHLQLNVSLDTLFFGIGLGVLTWQTESIYPAVFLHMLKNCLALTFILNS